jgi:hypothetical protein
MGSYLESQLLETIEAQNTTIKKLQKENKQTVQEALAMMQKYQRAIILGAAAMKLLEAKVKKLECEALGRSWNAKQ